MPELPDVTVYVERLASLTVGARLRRVRVAKPFLLRSVAPPLSTVEGRTVRAVRRLGKRIVFAFAAARDAAGAGAEREAVEEDELFLVLHLMIAGRLHWKPAGAKVPARIGLAAFDFDIAPAADVSSAPGVVTAAGAGPATNAMGPQAGTLILTEAGSQRRASLHVVASAAGLAAHDRGGLEVLDSDLAAFASALLRENHTLKRALTDPRLFSGIGNAYSDEILHRARLSPFRMSRQLTDDEITALREAVRAVLGEWTARLRVEAESAARAGVMLPGKVTAFRPDMAVHGRYGLPCPACGAPVQRVIYAANEANYCARCQTGGRLLADRVLSRLMKDDWPATLEELEERRAEPPRA